MNDTIKEYLNETVIENDVFEDILTKVNHYEPIQILEKYFIISEFIEFICNIVNMAAYIFLGLTIYRFIGIKSRVNVYILHLVTTSVVFTIFKVILNTVNLEIDLGSFLEQSSTSVLLLYLIISLILALDWFMSGYKPHFMVKYNRYYKYVVAVLYGVILTEYFLTFIYSHMHHMIRMGISRIFYAAVIFCMIVLNIMKRCVTLESQSAKTAHAFSVSNVIIFSLIPVFIWHTIITFTDIDNYILVCLSIIPEILWYNHPILVVIILGVQNKKFKMAYHKWFRPTVQSYEDEDLVEESVDGNNAENRNNCRDNSSFQDNGLKQTSVV